MQSQRNLVLNISPREKHPTLPPWVGGRDLIQGGLFGCRDLTQNGHVVRPSKQTFTLVHVAQSVNILAALRTALFLSRVESPVG